MKLPPIAVVVLLLTSTLLAQSFDARNIHAATIGAATVSVSLPDTFSELTAPYETMRAIALASKEPELGDKLVGVYAGAADVQNATKDGLLPFYLKVACTPKLRLADSDLALLRPLYSEMFRSLRRESPAYQAYIRQLFERASKATSGKVAFTVPEVAHLRVVSSDRDHFTELNIANLSFAFSDHTVTTAYLVSTTFGLVRGRLLFFYVYKRFQSGDDVAAIKDFSERWFARIRSDNQ